MSSELKLYDFASIVSSLVNYSKTSNSFLSDGYTSMAGNTYFNALRFAEGIIIKEDIGQGYFHTFLNAIRIYSIKDKVLLADKSFNTCYYSKERVLSESKKMLVDLINDVAKKRGQQLNMQELEVTITRVLNNAFNGNQLDIAQNQLLKQLQ